MLIIFTSDFYNFSLFFFLLLWTISLKPNNSLEGFSYLKPDYSIKQIHAKFRLKLSHLGHNLLDQTLHGYILLRFHYLQ